MSNFTPSEHLMNLKGADYLPVKWRLVWFREEHPDGIIDTELIRCDDKLALFKATVEIPLSGGEGGGRATGYGSETMGDFKDFIEKAETKAIGRALGALGYGTQFAPDLDDGAAKEHPVDSPVERSDAPPRNRSTSRNTVPDAPQGPSRDETTVQASGHPVGGDRATPVQIDAINGIAQRRGITPSALDGMAKLSHRVTVAELTQRDAARFIEHLQEVPAKQKEMIPDTAGRHRN